MHTPELLELDHFFKIKEIDGYPSQIGHRISLMNYARITTFDAVKDMSISDLDLADSSDKCNFLLCHS